MKIESFKKLIDWDTNLKINQEVIARWTNSHHFFQAKAKITKLNIKSLRVKLEEDVALDFDGGWKAGHKLVIPRISDFMRWSVNNCVNPI